MGNYESEGIIFPTIKNGKENDVTLTVHENFFTVDSVGLRYPFWISGVKNPSESISDHPIMYIEQSELSIIELVKKT